jgi:Ran GTPase-activating protein (RanGAP) involved in mRNA processing and transport
LSALFLHPRRVLADALQANTTLTSLNLQRNGVGAEGAARLGRGADRRAGDAQL